MLIQMLQSSTAKCPPSGLRAMPLSPLGVIICVGADRSLPQAPLREMHKVPISASAAQPWYLGY